MIRIYQLTFILTEFTMQEFSHAPDANYTNETLVRHGFIGATPDKPVIAFSFKLFEIYRQLHRVCPRLSVDGLSACLSHLHHVNTTLSFAIHNLLIHRL
jgi:hypothetical protein